MIAAWLLVLSTAPIAQDTSAPPSSQKHRAALDVDPRSLPQAPAGRWTAFDPKAPRAEDIPRSFTSVGPALAARDLPAAIEALQRCLNEAPDFPPAWHQLGVLYFRLQRYGDAVIAFERYLAAVPARVGDTRALGHAYYSLGRHADARAHYERVLAVSPDDVEARRGLALAHSKLGEPARALVLLRDVVAREPKHLEAWTWIAQILFDDENGKEALEAATKARDLDPFQPRPWFLLARIQSELGDETASKAAQQRFEMLSNADQEVRRLETRLEYDPRDLASLVELARIHRSTGDVARAKSALARAVELAPNERELRVFALDVLEGLGDARGARAAAEELERRFEDDPAVWQRLEHFYAKLRDRPNQVRAGERYRRLKSG